MIFIISGNFQISICVSNRPEKYIVLSFFVVTVPHSKYLLVCIHKHEICLSLDI